MIHSISIKELLMKITSIAYIAFSTPNIIPPNPMIIMLQANDIDPVGICKYLFNI